MQDSLNNWLETWAPNCGAPRKVFVGQFHALMNHLFNEVCLRVEKKIQLTGKLEDAHYAAMREVWQEMQQQLK